MTNAPYGLARKMLLVQAQAYRKEYGSTTVHTTCLICTVLVITCNSRTFTRNFSAHQAYEAKERQPEVHRGTGTGTPTREFSECKGDAAGGIVLATQKYDSPEPVNLGSGQEISIKELQNSYAVAWNSRAKLTLT